MFLYEKGTDLPPSSSVSPPPPPTLLCSRWQDSGWRVQEADVAGRRDLRRERAMSVDPPGCQDIDDAMHVTRKPDGKLEVRCVRCALWVA